jgi:hypothetical protein
LNWWKLALFDKNTQTLIENVLKEIVGRANLVNWSYETAEDAFRMLYEFLVEPKVRRQLGEYYTPIWLVEMIIKEFDLTKKVVLDPFCGSGTFLIKSFHEKVEKGESPEEALNEVVGFDINPLAVSVARAELLLAYRRVSGKEPVEPPYIYHADTLGTWFGKYVFPAMGLYELAKKASAYMDILINLKQINIGDASNILATLKKLEKNLTYAIRFAHNECRLEEKCLEEKIARYLEQGLGGSADSFTARFLEHFKTENVAGVIAKLLVTHGGNDVWAVVFMSIYAPILMTGFKASIIVTNPPWIPVYEYKAPYSEKIRNYMKDGIVSCIGKKATQVLAGADIASASLVKSIEYASDGVGYIMSREQLFNHSSSVPAGIIATYCLLEKALKNSNSKVKFYDFDFDVFQHGMPPAVVIVKKG